VSPGKGGLKRRQRQLDPEAKFNMLIRRMKADVAKGPQVKSPLKDAQVEAAYWLASRLGECDYWDFGPSEVWVVKVHLRLHLKC